MTFTGSFPASPFKRHFEITLGKMLQPNALRADDYLHPYLRAANIEWGRVNPRGLKEMFFSKSDLSKYSVSTGDLVVLEGGDVGRASIVQQDLDGTGFQNSVHRVRAKKGNHIPFALFWMQHLKTSGYFDLVCSKATLAHFTSEKFAVTPFPLIDLPTQKRIAAFLDRETARIDELIAKKERLVEVLNATHAATPLRVMFGGMGVIQYDPTNNRVDFSSLSEGWKRVRVKQVAKHMTSGSRGWSDFIQDDGELFLQSGSIDRKMGISFEDSHKVAPQSGAEADRTTVHNGDTLVCITGGRTGAVGFVSGLNERAYINQHVCLIRPSKAIEGRLLAQILFSEIGQLHFQMAQYGLKQGMGFEQVANVAIPLPPREQQEAITAAIDVQASRTTQTASQIMTSVERLREYRAALITAAVTGQIDVDTYGKTGATSATLDKIEEEMQA